MNEMQVYQYKQLDGCSVKDVDRKTRTMIGAFTRYNVLDSDGDIGRKGMFTKTWKENFSRIKHFLNHDILKPVGALVKLWDDEEYAYYESKIGTHKLGDDVLEMAESKLLTEHSYGYRTTRNNKTKEGNELLEVKHFELSNLTAWGANQHTPLLSVSKGMLGADIETKMADRAKALENFCRNTTASDETIELLLLEHKQLQQVILDLSKNTTHAADNAPEPEKKDELNTDEILSFIHLQKSLITTN